MRKSPHSLLSLAWWLVRLHFTGWEAAPGYCFIEMGVFAKGAITVQAVAAHPRVTE
jgi:hypothetical protein